MGFQIVGFVILHPRPFGHKDKTNHWQNNTKSVYPSLRSRGRRKRSRIYFRAAIRAKKILRQDGLVANRAKT